jgi:hypothetical protein
MRNDIAAGSPNCSTKVAPYVTATSCSAWSTDADPLKNRNAARACAPLATKFRQWATFARASPGSSTAPVRRTRLAARGQTRELPLDILEFSILTPLPGSEDHAKAVAKGVDIDPDLNKFDLEHVTTDHPRMSREEWQEAHRLAWRTYFIEDDIKTVIRRAVAGGPRPDTVAYLLTWFRASFHFYNIYPLETGIFRSDTVATAGRVFRARTRFSFMRATGAGQVVTLRQYSRNVRQDLPMEAQARTRSQGQGLY